jgi:ABC-type nitrate/sulfonate/bicarbonate transport system substrate-binding protein
MRLRQFAYALIALATLLVATAPSSTASGVGLTGREGPGEFSVAAQGLAPVKFNVTFRSALYADMYVGIAKGFFADEGVALEMLSSPMPNPPVLLLTGAANVISGWPGLIYVGNAQGADMGAIYSAGGVYEAWVASPEVTAPEQLAGSQLGVFTLIDLDVIYTHRMMQKLGIRPDQYTLVAAGISPEKVAAIKAGKVKAAPIYPPANFLAVNDGLTQVYDTLALGEQVPSTYIVSAAWAENNADTVVKMIRGLNKAHDWLLDPANEAEAISILIEYTQLQEDVARQTYVLYFQTPGAYSKSGEWTREQFENAGADAFTYGLLDSPPLPYEQVALPQYREMAAR